MDSNKRLAVGILNFFVWGLGYLYDKKYVLAVLWLVAFALNHLPIMYLGLGFYLNTQAGLAFLSGHTMLSVILLYMALTGKATPDLTTNFRK